MSGSAARVPGGGEERLARLESLEAAVADLRRAVAEIERRTASLEARAGDLLGRPPAPGESEAEAGASPSFAGAPGGAMALLGRTLVVLGGAFLLRAVTDAGVLPAALGVAAGLAYAGFWLLECDRDAARRRIASAHFHGIAALLMLFSLVAEATARFRMLAPPASAAVLVASLAAALHLARRRHLPAVAWLATLAAVAVALGLLVATGQLVPFTLALLAIAAATEGLALEGRFDGLRWLSAAGADLAVLVTAEVLSRPGGPPGPYAGHLAAGVALELLLVALAVGSATLRARRGIGAGPFDFVQTPLGLALGLGGAARILAATGASTVPLALLALLLGAAGYASALGALARRAGLGWSFHLHATLGGVLVWAGLRALLPDPALSIALVGLGLAAAWKNDPATLRVHAGACLIAGASVSGLFAAAVDAWLAPASAEWHAVTPSGLLAALGAAAGYALLARATSAPAKLLDPLPRMAIAALAGGSAAGLGVREIAERLGAGPGPGADAAAVAAVRTAALVALALALAWAGRRLRREELAWLAAPVLALAGLKLLLEDLRYGRPATLFLALTLLGGALVATSRLERR